LLSERRRDLGRDTWTGGRKVNVGLHSGSYGNTPGAECDLLHDIGCRERHQHSLDLGGHVGRRTGRHTTLADDGGDRLVAYVKHVNAIARVHQPACHAFSHLADADESDLFCHSAVPLNHLGLPSPAWEDTEAVYFLSILLKTSFALRNASTAAETPQ